MKDTFFTFSESTNKNFHDFAQNFVKTNIYY